MSDRPWLEDGDPSLRVERELLKRLNARQPPAGSAELGWGALAAEISALHVVGSAAAGHAGAGATHAAAHGFGWGGTIKVALGVAIAGGGIWAGSELAKPDSASPSAAPRQQLSAPSHAPADSRPALPVTPIETPAEDAGDSSLRALPPSPARPANPATTLAEEGRLLAKAHQLVQSGQGAQALEVLRLSGSRYPRSALSQEREVLTIEALRASGNSAAAAQRTERFLKRYPSSPHAGRLQRLVE